MEKKHPTHLRVNSDSDICRAVSQSKIAISAKTGRKHVSDREALRALIFSNNGQIVDILGKEIKGMKEKCCIYEPKIKSFPFTPLQQTIFHFIDGHLSRDEIMTAFKTLNSKAEIIEDQIHQKIKEAK